MNWIERVNTERNIDAFIDEAFLIEHFQTDDVFELNWMRIFNSRVQLSNEFIIEYVEFIDWNWLTRLLDESLLNRYYKRVIQWNAQLYGPVRTFEFMAIHSHRFDWNLLSHSPPAWFTDIHFDAFGDGMDWNKLTKSSKRMGVNVISKYAEKMDWGWMSLNDIRSEAFGFRFASLIHWNHPDLDITCLSTEFLYNISETVKLINEMRGIKLPSTHDCLIRIGSSISVKFAYDHQYELDWIELAKKDLITDEMRIAIGSV